MKRIIAILLLAVVIISACGCSTSSVFSIDNYGVSVACPSGWSDVTEGTPYDLQLTDKSSYFSIMAYKTVDLADGQAPHDVYALHNQWIKETRDNCTTVKNEVTRKYGNNIIVETLYSAEKNSSKNYYDSYLITNSESDTFLWVLITSLPSMYESKCDTFKEIIESIVLE